VTGIALGRAALQSSPFGHGALCAGRPLRGPTRHSLIIFLSTSDHFMIMLGALLIIFTASLQRRF